MTLERIGMEIAKRLPTDKLRSGLFEFYGRLFAPLREYPIRLVELGTWHGGALVSYARYFRNGFMLGAELNGPWLRKVQAHVARVGLAGRVRVEEGDAADVAFLQRICASWDPHPIDVVIDDASHQVAQARASLYFLWPRLRPGGFYIVEDWQAAYTREQYAADGGLPALLNEMLRNIGTMQGNCLASEITVHPRAFVMRKA